MSALSRRTALKKMASIAAAGNVGGACLQGGAPANAKPRWPSPCGSNETIGTIKPALYSQFAEHIGGVIYDGIWVGPQSKIANIDGIRRSLVEHVRRLGRVVVRWPGGCFADRYHWRDGIGSREKRPRRFGRWKEVTESNHFGTHEFMRFCRLCDVEPYFAANVGTGSAEEFQQWVEYCNAPAGATTLADERVRNGDDKPFGVRYWGVGNESWGCGGKFTPEDYCREYRKFTEWVPQLPRAAVPHRRRTQRQQPRLDAAIFQEVDRLRACAALRLGAALLLRHDRPRPEVQRRSVVRDARQGQPDGETHHRSVGRARRVRPRA